jgi:hypothetical protein
MASLVGVCAIALGSSAGATVLRAAEVEELARRAEHIVRGTVLSSTAAWTPDGKQIHTVTRISVARALKGRGPAVVEVRTPGGSVGDLAQKVIGAPEFAPGEEVIVFLHRHGSSSRYGVEGFSLGKFTVVPGQGQARAALVTQHLAGVGLPMPDGKVRPPPAFQPVREEEFLQRVQKALGEKATP